MRPHALATVLLLTSAVPWEIGAQDIPLLSAEVELINFGLEDTGDILRGELYVAWADDGPELAVSHLRDRPPAVLPTSVQAVPPSTGTDGCFDLDPTALAGMNALGGRFGAYALRGTEATADLGHDPDGRRVMRFQCQGGPSGICGLWIQLFDPDEAIRTYVDTSGLSTLAMWISHRPGDARFVVKAADAAWDRREDALAVGALDDFAADAVEPGGWRRVSLPLAALPGQLARDSLATLALEAEMPGSAEALVAGIELCGPDGRPQPLPDPVPVEPPQDTGHKALWIWNTRELVDDSAARAEFLEFVEAGGFDRIFLQIVPKPGESPDRGFVPIDAEGMGALVGQLHDRGALTYASDGDPHYALPPNHDGILRTVRAIAEHNRTSPAEERFHGVHYDIEPYLLEGFQGPRREPILDGFVEIVEGIARVAREAGLEVGVAVPFWLDVADSYTGESLSAELEGRRADILDHLVELVDELAVMDYRTTAEGPNGSVALVLGELEAAERTSIGIWVGVETAPILDADVVEFGGVPERGLPPADDGRWVVAEPSDGGTTRFWLVPEGGRDRLAQGLERPGRERRLLRWRAGPPVRVPGETQTFHRLGARRMESEVGSLLTELADHPAFLGIAYHHYLTLRALRAGEGR